MTSRFRPLPIGTTPKTKRTATRLMKAWVALRDDRMSSPAAFVREREAFAELVTFVSCNNLTGTVYDPR